jgi:AcrR family transcriptional regulator
MSEDRRLTEQGTERKQQLLESAESLFAERGYGPTRVADICAAAGVAKGLFYWYFPSKEAVFTDLVRSMRWQLRRAQGEAMDPAADPLTRIRQGAVASTGFMADHHSYFALLDMERSDPALDEVLREGSEVYVADVEHLVREAQAAGSVIDLDPRTLAIGVVGAVSSFGRARRDARISLDDEELAWFVSDWVVRAISASGDEAHRPRGGARVP